MCALVACTGNPPAANSAVETTAILAVDRISDSASLVGVIAFAGREDLISILRTLGPDDLRLIGYVGADGDVHVLADADLRPTVACAGTR